MIVEELGPLAGSAVAGEQNALLLVALGDDVVDVSRPVRARKWLEPEVVDHEQVGFEVGGEATLDGVVCAAGVEMSEHLVGVGEEDVEALARGFVRKGLRDVGLSDAALPDEQAVPASADELAGGEVHHLLAAQGGVEAEVEGLEGLAGLDPPAAQAEVKLLGRTPLDLVGEQPAEKLDVAPGLRHRLLVTDVQGVEDAGEPQAVAESPVHGSRSWPHAPSAATSSPTCRTKRYTGRVTDGVGSAPGSGSESVPAFRVPEIVE